MLTRSFDRAFSHLVRVFKHYHDVWRSPDNISELGSARWILEEARADMRRERDRERTRTQTEAEPSDRPFLKMAVSEDDMGRLRFAALGGNGSGGAHFSLGQPERPSHRLRQRPSA